MIRDYLIRYLADNGRSVSDAEIEADSILFIIDDAGYRLITKERYEEWKHDSNVLTLAEMYGVDNWEGWDLVVQELRENS